MKRKSIFIFFTLFFAGVSVVLSQNNNGNVNAYGKKAKEFAEIQMANLKADITLTAEQEQKIVKLLEKLYKDREKSAEKETENQKINSKKLDYEKYVAARDSLLTNEQILILQQKAEERKNAGTN